MGDQSKIQWTDATWNPWHGCKKVSPGCKYCYMYRDKDRYGQDPTTVMFSKTKFNEPLKWEDPRMIFTCSWSDWFIEEADLWRPQAWNVIQQTPHHTYQILTKRPELIKGRLPDDWGDGYPNVWLGVSVEDRERCQRVEYLRDIPAAKKFVSAEPLIEGIIGPEVKGMISGRRFDFNNYDQFLDWVIVGGESGNEEGKWKYRPCEEEWIEKIVDWCQWNEIPVFVKQLGTHLAKTLKLKDRHGGDLNEWPEHLQIRQLPRI